MGTLNGVDDAEKLGGKKGNTQQNKEKAPTSHRMFLLLELLFYTQYNSNKRSCQEKSNKNSIKFYDAFSWTPGCLTVLGPGAPGGISVFQQPVFYQRPPDPLQVGLTGLAQGQAQVPCFHPHQIQRRFYRDGVHLAEQRVAQFFQLKL